MQLADWPAEVINYVIIKLSEQSNHCLATAALAALGVTWDVGRGYWHLMHGNETILYSAVRRTALIYWKNGDRINIDLLDPRKFKITISYFGRSLEITRSHRRPSILVCKIKHTIDSTTEKQVIINTRNPKAHAAMYERWVQLLDRYLIDYNHWILVQPELFAEVWAIVDNPA